MSGNAAAMAIEGVGVLSAALGSYFAKKLEQGASLLSDIIKNIKAKGSRSHPELKGEPNSTVVERNPDGSVKRVTQFDENGNFVKEIRPDPVHGIEGPNTKTPKINVDESTGKSFHNGYRVEPATPSEIELLK